MEGKKSRPVDLSYDLVARSAQSTLSQIGKFPHSLNQFVVNDII